MKKRNKQEFLLNNKEKSNNKLKRIKYFIVFIVVIAIVIYSAYLIGKLVNNPSDTFIVSNGTLSKEETQVGYIVRNESIIDTSENSNKNIVKIKQDGERVAKGDSIFRYYSEKDVELENEISKVDEEMQTVLQNNDTTILSTDKKLLETQIQSELDNMYQNNEYSEIQSYKKNINTYITKKAKIIGESSPAGSYIKTLIEKREEYEKELANETQYVVATDAGMVSYKVDGLESTLNTSDFNKLNKSFLESLNLKTGETLVSSDSSCKIINNYDSYLIFNSDSAEAKSAKVNDKIKIRIQNSSELTATINNIIEETDGTRTISIEIKKDIEELISYRKISFDIIWWSASGFRIPNSAIEEINGVNYVIRNRNGYLNKMAIKILKQNGDYSLVSTYTRSELLDLGLTSDEISDLKTITLYDRIQLNPTI